LGGTVANNWPVGCAHGMETKYYNCMPGNFTTTPKNRSKFTEILHWRGRLIAKIQVVNENKHCFSQQLSGRIQSFLVATTQ